MRTGIQHMASLILFLAGIYSASALNAQSDSTAVEPVKIRLSLTYQNINNTGPRLLATVKTKVGRSYTTLEDIKINFYYGESDGGEYLGSLHTNGSGEALFLVPETLRKVIDTTGLYHYTAAVENQEGVRDKETDIEIIQTRAELKFIEEDSVRKIRYRFLAADSAGMLSPVAGLKPVFHVERLFGLLPISGDFTETDEEGYCEIVCPGDLPGDKDGRINVVVKIDDHDDYGTIISKAYIDWGTPLIQNEMRTERELWSSRANAPRYLVIIVNTILLGIGFTLLYIVYNLYRIYTLSHKKN